MSLFYEPSTPTRFSLETAMLRLGGEVITTESAGQFSSTVKGETIEDMIKIISSYAGVIVLRHNEFGSAKLAAGVSNVTVINAGDGTGQHPTPLLDLYTIRDAFRIVDGLHIRDLQPSQVRPHCAQPRVSPREVPQYQHHVRRACTAVDER